MSETMESRFEHAQRIKLELDEMLHQGVLVDLNCRGLSMFVTQVDWVHDLGIPPGDARRRRLRPGTKSLLPDEVQNALRSIEVRIRRNLADHSRKLSVFGAWSWIPNTAYEAWSTKHESLVEEHATLKQDILERYDYYVDRLREDFAAVATEAWYTLSSYTGDDGQTLTADRDFESFRQMVISIAEAKLPKRDDIQAKLLIEIIPGLLMLPSDYEAEQLERSRLLAERQAVIEQRRHEQVRLNAETEAARVEAQAREQVAWTQARLEIETMEARAQLEQERIDRMHRLEMERARALLAETVSPFQEIIDSLRAQIYETTLAVTTSIRKHGNVRGKTVEQIRGMLETFRLLNVAGDHELEERLLNLEHSLTIEGVDTKRDTGAVLSALRQVAKVAIDQGAEVAERLRPTQESLIEI